MDTKLKKWTRKNIVDDLIILILTVLMLGVIGIGAVFKDFPWEDENTNQYFLSQSFENLYETYASRIGTLALADIAQNDVEIDGGEEVQDSLIYMTDSENHYRNLIANNPRIFYKIYNQQTGITYSESRNYQEARPNALVLSQIEGDYFSTYYFGNDLGQTGPYALDNIYFHNEAYLDVLSRTPVKVIFGIVNKESVTNKSFEDEVNQDYNRFLLMKSFGRHLNTLTIAFVLGAFLILMLLIGAFNRRARYAYPQDIVDRIPNDLKLILGTLTVTGIVAFFDYLDIGVLWFSTSRHWSQQIVYVFLIILCVYLSIVIVISLLHALVAKRLFKESLIFKVLHMCFRGIKNFFEASFRDVALQRQLTLFLVATLVIIFFNLLFALASSTLLFFMLFFDLWVAYMSVKIVFSMGHIAKVMKDREKGLHDQLIDKTKLLKMFYPLADQINNAQLGLNEAVEKAVKGEKLKTELITNVSHDLKTPLTSIINYVSLLMKMDLDNDEASTYVSVIDEKSNRLKVLIEDILDVSKISTGNVEITLESIDLNQMMMQMLGEYEERFKEIPLTLIHSDFSQPFCVKADADKLRRILDNLFTNLEKYTLENTRVYISTKRMTTFTQLELKNISKDFLQGDSDLFLERFMRGDSSRTTEGSGLGLAIANDLAILLKGHLEIEVDGDLFKAKLTLENDESP